MPCSASVLCEYPSEQSLALARPQKSRHAGRLRAESRRPLVLLGFVWLGRMAFQFDHNHIQRRITGVFRQVDSRGFILRLACFGDNLLCFAIRMRAWPFAVLEENRT